MKTVVLLSVLMVFGFSLFPGCASIKGETTGEYIDDSMMTTKGDAIIVNDPAADYFKIEVMVKQGDVVLIGFVNSRETEERLVAKIREIRGVKSVKSLLKMEERKSVVSGSTLIA